MTSGNRTPTTRERENNRRRERRRRAMAAKIYAGLRTYGNYKLPKHCDNNEVLKALCQEAGWTVESDGTTYRKGCKPVEQTDTVGCSASPSPCSSYQPSRCVSYNPSPTSSSFPSPARSPYPMNDYKACDGNNDDALLPWLKNLPSSISVPVTPPLSSPTSLSPRRIKANHEADLSFLQSSTPPSPSHQLFPHDSSWFAGIYIPNGSSSPTSPTFSLVSRNPFNPFASPGAWTPGQSGTCSPATMGRHEHLDVCDEFAFGSCGNGDIGLVKAWEGERIHEECGQDELELTLGPARTRV